MGPPPDVRRLVAHVTRTDEHELSHRTTAESAAHPRWLRDETFGFAPVPRASAQALRPSRRPLLSPAEERGAAVRAPLALDDSESLSAMFDALSLGDYPGALLLAEILLDETPSHGMALEVVSICRAALGRAAGSEASSAVIEESGVVPLGRSSAPAFLHVGIEALSPVSLDSSMDEEVELMFERLAGGNYPTALLLAESILERSPDNGDAEQCAGICRSEMRKQYAMRLGSLSHVPQRLWSDEELASADHDRVTRYVLARVDDQTSIEQILDAAELPTLEVLRSLYELKVQGTIALVPRLAIGKRCFSSLA